MYSNSNSTPLTLVRVRVRVRVRFPDTYIIIYYMIYDALSIDVTSSLLTANNMYRCTSTSILSARKLNGKNEKWPFRLFGHL